MFQGISYHLQYLVRSALAVGVAGEADERRDRDSPVCVFITGVFVLLLSSEGLAKGNNIGKIVLRSQRASETHCTLSFLPGKVL